MSEPTPPVPHINIADKEPLSSDELREKMKEAMFEDRHAEANELINRFTKQTAVEQAEKKAHERANAQSTVAYEFSADEEEEADFDGEEESEKEPTCRFELHIGGSPAKTAGLTEMKDLVRVEGEIGSFRFVSTEDGVVELFPERFNIGFAFETLYESLTLPTRLETPPTTLRLFDDISELFQKNLVLPVKECSLLAYWSMATWLADYLPFLPSILISGPASSADLLLRTMGTLCRRPVLLAQLNSAIVRKLPISELTPTLLVREAQLNRNMLAFLSASNQPGYLFLNGETFEQLYCPKCLYVGEELKDRLAISNSIQINLGGSVVRGPHSLPTEPEINSFQNRLLTYRLLNHDKVAAANPRISGFLPEINGVAAVLTAAVVDADLQREVIEVLKDRDEQGRVDRASGVNGVVLRAVLSHCHQGDSQKSFVREIAATANRIYADDGESLRVSSEAVGHVLKYLGLYTRRLGNAGRGLVFDKATQAQAHKLGASYDVLTWKPTCEYCHELQQPQSEEVVHDV